MLLAAADPTGDATLLWRAAHDARSRTRRGSGCRARAVDRDRLPRALPPSARAIRGVCSWDGGGSLRRSPGARGSDRCAGWIRIVGSGMRPPRRRDQTKQSRRSSNARRTGPGPAPDWPPRRSSSSERSALTDDPARRADRALAAAQAHLQAGAFDAARGLLAEAAAVAVDDLQRARIEQLNGQIEAGSGPGREAPLRLLQAATRLEGLDGTFARDTYLQAWWAALLAGPSAAPGGELLTVSNAALSAPTAAEPRPCDLLLEGLATIITAGRAAAAPTLRRAVDLYLDDQVSADDWIQWGRSATTAAYALWDFESWATLSTRQVALTRESGALNPLVISLNFHAVMITWCGDFEVGRRGGRRTGSGQGGNRSPNGVVRRSAARCLPGPRGRCGSSRESESDRGRDRRWGWILHAGREPGDRDPEQRSRSPRRSARGRSSMWRTRTRSSSRSRSPS